MAACPQLAKADVVHLNNRTKARHDRIPRTTLTEVHLMQVNERDRRYFIWLAIICGAVFLYAWLIYPGLIDPVIR